MAEQAPTKETTSERLARFGSNINVIGAVAIGGVAALIPGPNVVLASWAGLNAVQAGGFELWRQHSKNKKQPRRTAS